MSGSQRVPRDREGARALQRQRKPDVHRAAGDIAQEAAWRHADDDKRQLVQQDMLADSRGRRAKGALRELIPQHGGPLVLAEAFVSLHKRPPRRGPHTQAGEVVVGHGFAGHLYRPVLRCLKRSVVCVGGRHQRDPGCRRAQALVSRVGDGPALVEGAARRMHPDQLRRLRHRQIGQHHRIQQLEDAEVGADAKGQCEQRRNRQRGGTPQLPQGLAQIAQQMFQPHAAPLLPRHVFNQQNVAHLAQDRGARLLGMLTLRNAVRCRHRHMGRQLFRQVFLRTLPGQPHQAPASACITAPMARTIRIQRSWSAVSCFRPSAVSW